MLPLVKADKDRSSHMFGSLGCLVPVWCVVLFIFKVSVPSVALSAPSRSSSPRMFVSAFCVNAQGSFYQCLCTFLCGDESALTDVWTHIGARELEVRKCVHTHLHIIHGTKFTTFHQHGGGAEFR